MSRPPEPVLAELPDEWVGARVVVRQFRDADDVPLYRAIVESREHIRQWLPWADAYQRQDDATSYIRRSTAQALLRDAVPLGIFSRSTGDLLGGTGIHVLHWTAGSFEIGYWLRKSAEGHGYMSEAVKLQTEFLFTKWEAERVSIRCDSRNARSAHVAQRLGFVHEGTLRHDGIATDGAIRDTMIFALTPADFARVKQGW